MYNFIGQRRNLIHNTNKLRIKKYKMLMETTLLLVYKNRRLCKYNKKYIYTIIPIIIIYLKD